MQLVYSVPLLASVQPTLKLFASQCNNSSSRSFRSPSVFLLSIRTRREGGLANSCSVVSVFSAAANTCSERGGGKQGKGEARREEREERGGEKGGKGGGVEGDEYCVHGQLPMKHQWTTGH